MLFDTPVYILFLALVVPVYWWLKTRRRQNPFLLAVSYLFYGWWDWRFLGLILASTVVDFYCAREIDRSDDPGRRKVLLTVSVTVNLAFLGFFKYFNFFIDSAAVMLGALGLDVPMPVLRILLPPGISFYTFQELAYIVDVYKRRIPPARSLVDYALFISLFPHLIAGPIQRPSHLLPQVEEERRKNFKTMTDGLLLILMGLFRKVVIADNCALLANSAFDGNFGPPTTAVVLLGVYAFAWQIYGDFSGYSDIARGSAQLLGFHFIVNFRQPYLSRSIQEFWRRWHISLSTWLRDYLYIPLGGNRRGERRTYKNLLTTMVLGGLWHGANWTFVIWGALHGAMLAVTRFFTRGREEPDPVSDEGQSLLRGWGKRVLVFHVVCLAWIFFRAPSVGEAAQFLGGVANWDWRPEYAAALWYLGFFTLPLFVVDLHLERSGGEYPLATAGARPRMALAAVLVGMIALLAGTDSNAFIYFQF
ncbi:MAG: MBOAT family protein [Gemmatimonadales bacterium]|nr:MBOAT family protein [Gemmatimonadales bacterium]